MRIAIAGDHAGYELKMDIKKILEEKGYEVIDFGIDTEENCDLPDYIYPAALYVAKGRAEKGIFIDGLGYGSAIIANKIYGIYAAVCNETFSAALDNYYINSNVLCLGGKIINSDMAKKIIEVWLRPILSNDARENFIIRKQKVKRIEERHLKKIEEFEMD